MGFWPVVLSALKNSDVILLVVDARMPEMTTNSEILAKVETMNSKRVFLVFNKIDLVSFGELKKLKKANPNSFFVSSVRKTGIRDLKKSLENMADNWVNPSLRVGLVGYPNVGKSSVLNLLVRGANAKVKAVSGTTRKVQWIRSGKLRFQDSPGVIPRSDRSVKVGITSSKDPHKIKNPEKVAIRLIEYLDKKSSGSLAKFYGVTGQGYDLFLAIGEKKKFLIKGGEVDEHRTAVKIIEDWQKGNIRLK